MTKELQIIKKQIIAIKVSRKGYKQLKNSPWKEFKQKHKGRITAVLIASTLGLVGYQQYEISSRGLNVVYGEKNIGIVRDKEEVIEVVNNLEEKLSKDLKKDIKIDKEISFVETHIKDKKVSKKEEIEKAINDDLSYSAVAYAIKVDEKEIAYLESQEQAKLALKEYKELVIEELEETDEEAIEVKSAEILEDVSLVKKEIPLSEIEDIDSTIEKIKTGAIEEKKYTISGEDNFWTLSEDYNMTMEEIERANPDKDTKKLKAGDEVVIPLTKPVLTIATYEEKNIEEELDFKTEYQTDDELYENKEEVRVEGKKGKIEKQIEIERHNGEEVEERVIKEDIITEPVTQVVAKGTKPVPLGLATGSFTRPTQGPISSPFGPRWGSFHGGIDIAAPIGEPIIASDGGTVTHASFNNGGYGYMVDIDHGNGYVTRYAHCSEIFVNNGDKVNQGDSIAAVGNTGRSTGPHLHFEIRKNGSPEDPQKYLD